MVPISGGLEPEDPQNIEPGGEVDLDVDLATSLIYPQEAIVYQVNDREGHWNPPEWFEVFLDYFDDSYCDHIAYDIGGNFSTRYGGYHKARNESELRRDCGPHHLARVISISYVLLRVSSTSVARVLTIVDMAAPSTIGLKGISNANATNS